MTYAEKLKDPRWQRKRLEVMELANFTCEDCKSTTQTLHAHHCYYIYKRQPWEYEAGLMCLCEECHKGRQECEQLIHQALALKMRFMRPDRMREMLYKATSDTGMHLASIGIDPGSTFL